MTTPYNLSEFQVSFTQVVSKIDELMLECIFPDKYVKINNGKYQFSDEALRDPDLVGFRDRCSKIRSALKIDDLAALKVFERRDAVR